MTDRTQYATTYEENLAARRAEGDKLRAAAWDDADTHRARYVHLLDTLQTKEQLTESRVAIICER